MKVVGEERETAAADLVEALDASEDADDDVVELRTGPEEKAAGGRAVKRLALRIAGTSNSGTRGSPLSAYAILLVPERFSWQEGGSKQ
jgi:hypothetical protein